MAFLRKHGSGPARYVFAGLVVSSAIIAGLTLLGSAGRVGAANDPQPSPLFQSSLDKSVRQVSTPLEQQGGDKLAAVPHPEQKNRWPLGGQVKAASPQAIETDAFVAEMRLMFSPDPGLTACEEPTVIQLFGPVVVERQAPPYTTGVDIPIEIVAMNLQGVSPWGPVTVTERVGYPSSSLLDGVVADGGGNIVQYNSRFDIFIDFQLPGLGIDGFFGPGSEPFVDLTAFAFPPIGVYHEVPLSHPPAQVIDKATGEPVGTICGGSITPMEEADADTLCWCIYELVCASGDPTALGDLGLCVGDKRRGAMCASPCEHGTCVLTLQQTDGAVCLHWQIAPEFCAPSSLPFIPNMSGGSCPCDGASPTMPSSPSCPGDVSCPSTPSCGTTPSCPAYPSCPQYETCPEAPSCGGTETCPGTASCPSTASCPGVSSCRGEATCPWTTSCEGSVSCQESYTCSINYTCPAYQSCPGYISCDGSPSCDGTESCAGTPSCPSSPSCPNFATCSGYWSCQGTPTCPGGISCQTTPPLNPYNVVYSVAGGHNPAEGILQGIFGFPPPQPNDVYSLGPGNGYLTEGELFQSSGVAGGAAPDMTNLDRLSSSLGAGPAPLGGAPFTGPFAPTPGAPAPWPPPPGALGTFGLLSADNVDALSYGRDGGKILLFSVNTAALGLNGTAVYFEANVAPPSGAPISPFPPSNGGGDPGQEAAGDIFRSARFSNFGAYGGQTLNPAPYGSNALEIDEVLLGLQAPAGTWALGLGIGEDDLDALEAEDASAIDSDGDGIPNPGTHAYFSLDFASVQVVNGIADPFPGVATGPDPDGVTADDILISPVPGPAGPVFRYAIFARGVLDIGLLPGDDLDALVLSDIDPVGSLNPGDEILFSLAGGSPSLVAGANPLMPAGVLSPGDVYRKRFGAPPILYYARAVDLGLLDSDELDALDIGQCFGSCSDDFDSDNDGINDLCDLCRTVPDPAQSDADFDGVGDLCDNCLTVFNPDQSDTNFNGIGDACEVGPCLCPFQGDINNDGFIDAVDLAMLIDIVFFGAVDPQDSTCPTTRGDFNGDGFADATDLAELIDHVFFGGAGPTDPCTCPGGFPCP